MQIKICGIKTPETAIACFKAGASMIGLVHYPPSPRHVDTVRIDEILDVIKPFGGQSVLVVVDQLPDEEIVSKFSLVQAYGTLQDDISTPQIRVVKDYATFTWLLESPLTTEYFCLEMSKGTLPGGNGAAWDWSIARPFCERYSTFIAGGITPENVAEVIRQVMPFGIDVSSGVESSPGIKDIDNVKRLIENVHRTLSAFAPERWGQTPDNPESKNRLCTSRAPY